MGFELPGDCSGKTCGFSAIDGDLGCESGSGSCWIASFVEADESPFHDKQLQEATREIKAILDRIPEDRDGRKLSFVHTPAGTLLAWVKHGLTAQNKVTIDSDPDEIVRALGIKSERGW